MWSSIEGRHRTLRSCPSPRGARVISAELSGRLARCEANQPSSSFRRGGVTPEPCSASLALRGLAQRPAQFDRNHHVHTGLQAGGTAYLQGFLDMDMPYDPVYAGGYGLMIVNRKYDTKRRGVM